MLDGTSFIWHRLLQSYYHILYYCYWHLITLQVLVSGPGMSLLLLLHGSLVPLQIPFASHSDFVAVSSSKSPTGMKFARTKVEMPPTLSFMRWRSLSLFSGGGFDLWRCVRRGSLAATDDLNSGASYGWGSG